MAQRAGSHHTAAIAAYNLGFTLQGVGRLEAASRRLREAREIWEKLAREADVGWALGLEAHVLAELGKPAEAEAHLARLESMPRARRLP